MSTNGLSDPRTIEQLNLLLDNLEVITFSVQALDGLLRRSETLLDALSEGVAELRKLAPSGESDAAQLVNKLPQLARAGVKIAETTEKPEITRLVESGLLEELGKPETIQALKVLVGKAEMLAFAVAALEGFIRRSEEVADAVAESVDSLRELAPEVGGAAEGMLKLGNAAFTLSRSDILDKVPELTRTGVQLVESGIFEERTVDVLAEVGKTLAETYDEARQARNHKANWITLPKALNDPDVQLSLGFVLSLAKQYGQRLSK